ncbi:MAG: PhoH family protein [Rhodobacteraceae bacterium]|nr:PhoH family protein [Paracoccaceae bacterium]
MLVEFPDNRRLIELCGAHDQNLNAIENCLGIQIVRRGNRFALHGERAGQEAGSRVLQELYGLLERGRSLEPGDVDAAVRFSNGGSEENAGSLQALPPDNLEILTRRRVVEPRTPAQKRYVHSLKSRQLVFGIGPAGTGKTYLAVAQAVAMLSAGSVDRIILSRPAVEAGERLGFLPGDMKEKVDPYMQPLFDALRGFLQQRQLERFLERRTIEIAPLAFMRGRTLANSFIILDEAQNATRMQMKMFLTRFGPGSHMAVNGDITQVDLPKGAQSGLAEARQVLRNVKSIAFVDFTSEDVIRHPLVSKIVRAYADHDGSGPGH